MNKILKSKEDKMSKKRVFIYNEQRYDDPGEEFSIEDVRQALARTFPELATATWTETELEDVVEVQFAKRAGTKGMDVVEIGVEYSATQSLEGYCNVRPSVRLVARLGEGDDPERVRAALMAQARQMIHDEVDEALIADGQPPKHYAGPRYSLWRERDTNLITVVPDEVREQDLPGNWWRWGMAKSARNLRPDQARGLAEELAQRHKLTLIDCSDGDLSRLPEPPVAEQNRDELDETAGF